MEKKYLIIDAKNSLYRHNYTSNLTVGDQKISGVFGMFKEITGLIREYKPDEVFICWDKGKSRKRLEIYPEYKANRKGIDKEVLENLSFQTKKAKSIFKTLPVIQLELPNTEADDIIGFLTKVLKGQKIISSNDSDLIQLIKEDTKIIKSRRSVREELTVKNINEVLGFDKKYYVLHKSLTGDSSDNIKGIKGVGEKTATKIINKEIKKDIDKEILKRNLRLIKIGIFIDKEEAIELRRIYKKELTKKPNLIVLRGILSSLKFNTVLSNFTGFTDFYREIYNKRVSNG